MHTLETVKIGVVGLGYVGLPLAVEFSRHFPVLGFDINPARVAELQAGQDATLELDAAELGAAVNLGYSAQLHDLAACNFYIVTVPTPVDPHKRPDLSPLQNASAMLSRLLKPGDLVVYESTVYPGATEEVCAPLLEQGSGLDLNQDFYVGYSPERINPGDKQHRLPTIVKLTSASTPAAAELVDAVYRRIIQAGTYKTSSIRVAEAAKVIENVQRDVNIALMNELAQIFARLGIDTQEVLEAAGSKWNFLPFRPGLVGGHCIGVDPYYLVHKAVSTGYQPTLIPSARLLNEGMGEYVAGRLVRLMAQRQISPVGAKILVLGLSFKENCPDLRNTKVVDIIAELRAYNAEIDVHDPWVDPQQARHEYGLELVAEPPAGHYDAVLVAVAHREFQQQGAAALRAYGRPGAVLFDVKYVFPQGQADGRL